MRVEIPLDIGRLRRHPPASDCEKPAPEKPNRHDRRLRWTALALLINEMIFSGEWENYAEASRSCRVSRARISKLLAHLGAEEGGQ